MRCQTPVARGGGRPSLRVGDRVWFRHAKGGELAERLTRYYSLDPDQPEVRKTCPLTARPPVGFAQLDSSCGNLRFK